MLLSVVEEERWGGREEKEVVKCEYSCECLFFSLCILLVTSLVHLLFLPRFTVSFRMRTRTKEEIDLHLALVRLAIALLGRATGEERWIESLRSHARRSGPKELRLENHGQSILHSTAWQRIQMHGECRD